MANKIHSKKIRSIIKRMVHKSKEAFMLGIEIYNNPNVTYRTESFSFFICNAWNLMLQAWLINNYGLDSIYYNDKTPSKTNNPKTKSLIVNVRKIYNTRYDPIKMNLKEIIDLRNLNTHFITEDYDLIYAPLFQSNVLDFMQEMYRLNGVDLSKYIPTNFLNLGLNLKELSDTELRAKYSSQVARRIINLRKNINLQKGKENSTSFSIPLRTNFVIVRDPNKAEMSISIAPNSDTKARIIKKPINEMSRYPFTVKKALKFINKRLIKNHINITNSKSSHKKTFTMYDFILFNKFYNGKKRSQYSHYWSIAKRYTYSQKFIQLIYKRVKAQPHTIIKKLKKRVANTKKG